MGSPTEERDALLGRLERATERIVPYVDSCGNHIYGCAMPPGDARAIRSIVATLTTERDEARRQLAHLSTVVAVCTGIATGETGECPNPPDHVLVEAVRRLRTDRDEARRQRDGLMAATEHADVTLAAVSREHERLRGHYHHGANVRDVAARIFAARAAVLTSRTTPTPPSKEPQT